jgi:hypothetical protein
MAQGCGTDRLPAHRRRGVAGEWVREHTDEVAHQFWGGGEQGLTGVCCPRWHALGRVARW